MLFKKEFLKIYRRKHTVKKQYTKKEKHKKERKRK